ncbi:glycosyltransferase family 1 protein [Candidatus Parcubacteria bacterium]|nr:MAG: glycosyltransferase family 1 protein [Candidatus Parcubacteria bacterium]
MSKTIKKLIKKSFIVWCYLEDAIAPFCAKLTGKYIVNALTPVSKSNVRRSLIIYISEPFSGRLSRKHTNEREVLTMAEALTDIGFVVDVMDYRNPFSFSLSNYDLIIGFGDPFERVFYEEDNRAVKIFYATGASQAIHCYSEVERIRDVARSKGVRLTPKRVLDRVWPCSEILSDAVISVTDGWARSTFEIHHSKVFSVPVTSLSNLDKDNFDLHEKKKNHFVWFGSRGAIHKGLDLCLEAVKNRNDLVLHICGSVIEEKDFFSAFREELEMPNVVYHGFIDVNSDEMKHVMNQASFVLLPSCSEGCATSVLTCMSWGCIPVVTPQCGISFSGRVEIKDLSVQAVYSAIEKCLSLDSSMYYQLMHQSREWVEEFHSIEMYKDELKKALLNILASTYVGRGEFIEG